MNSATAKFRPIYQEASNIADLYRLAADVHGDCPATATRDRCGNFKAENYRSVYDRAVALATALIELGLQPRQHVAILADNRAEWMVCDAAILLSGCADVPRAADTTDQEITYILGHSDAVFVIVENRKVLDRLLSVRLALPNLKHIILIEGECPEGAEILMLPELIERGRHLRGAGDRLVEERLAQIKGSDLFTLIYTSGTTGTPKGVMLTHDNMMSQVRYLPFELGSNDRVLSILPVWHSYERVFEMVTVSRGACTYYTSIRTIAEDLKNVRPTWMASAPRLWEVLYNKILHNVAEAPLPRRVMFRAAYHCSRRFQSAKFFVAGRQIDLHGRSWTSSLVTGLRCLMRMALLAIPYSMLDALVLKKLRSVVGGEFVGTVSGGGALPPHVDEFFNYIGIPVLEGYGMTETSPVLAVRTWRKLVIGTVGPFWPHTEIRIVDPASGEVLYPSRLKRGGGRGIKGEIHARGPQVMRGYYKDPAGTGKVLRNGWMNTGDLGIVTFNDCLKIVGRSKETIVLSNGENVEPLPIEAQLLESRFIEQCMVVGQDEKNLGALIVPSLEGLKTQGFDVHDLASAVADPRVQDLIGAEVKRLVSREQGFKPFEFVSGWKLLAKPFEVGDELTSTFKPQRHVITHKYSALINEIFHHTRTYRQI